VTRRVLGHLVSVDPCDGLRDHWRVRADGDFVGLVVFDGPGGFHTLPARPPGGEPPPVLHAPTATLVVQALVAETEEKT
jgi:hypothetical protein